MSMKSLYRVGGSLSLAMLLLSGCSGDKEAALVGAWRADALAATGMVSQMKDGTPEVRAAAIKGFKAMELELRADKTFTLAIYSNTRTGTWTFDKDAAEVKLTLALTKDETEQSKEQPPLPVVWIATVAGYKSMRLFPWGAKERELIKSSGGPMASGILLKKN